MQKKQGISLIVLVITIIVMIILAASVVITLSNTGIINRASQAVDLTNESAVQDMAALVWADVFMDGKRGTELVSEVTTKLGEQGVTADKWNITVTDTGVSVTSKNNSSTTLGSLISKDNYGDTVDYTVTVDGKKYEGWRIYYHNSDYVYLIASESIGDFALDKGTTVASLTNDEKELYEKFRVGTGPKYTLVDTVNGATSYSSQAVAQLIKDYANFANTETYGTNVVGAIGGPTIELLVEAWNLIGYEPKLTITTGLYGYDIRKEQNQTIISDDLYAPYNDWYWLTSPEDTDDDEDDNISVLITADAGPGTYYYNYECCVRPVVCLKASIPATVGTTTDFSLVK